MAKGNLFLGNGRGSVGDVTLSVLNGKQLSRRRARVVANPQSSSQQLQRMVMATVTGNAARLRSLISHSFQGVRAGADSYNYFNKVNLKLLRSQAVSGQIQGFRIKGAETFVPCEGMILGKGIMYSPNLAIQDNGVSCNAVNFPAAFSSEDDYTSFLASAFNAKPGDEIAVMFVRATTEWAAEYNGFYQPKCLLLVRRMVFLPWNDAFEGQQIAAGTGAINTALLDFSLAGDGKPRSIVNGLQIIGTGDNPMLLCVGDDPLSAAAMFLSRPDGQGGWYNSNTNLVVASDVYYKADEIIAADIQGSYGPAAATDPSSDLYLEQSVPEAGVVPNPTLMYAMGFTDAGELDWDYLKDGNELVGRALEFGRNDEFRMEFDVALNFVPSMVRVNGVFTKVDVHRLIKSDIPAGSSIYTFNLEDGENTAREFTVDFFVQGSSKVTMNVKVTTYP